MSVRYQSCWKSTIFALSYVIVVAGFSGSAPNSGQQTDRAQDVLVTRNSIQTGTIRWVGSDPGESLNFRSGDQRVIQVSIEEFVWWNGAAARPQGARIHLIDESILVGHVSAIDAARIQILSPIWGSLQIERDQIKWIEVQIAADPSTQARRVQRALENRRDSTDMIELLSGDFISGAIVKTDSTHRLVLRRGEQRVRIRWNQIASIVFAESKNSTTAEQPIVPFEFSFRDGSRLRLSSIEIVNGKMRVDWALASRTLETKTGPRGETVAAWVCGIRKLDTDLGFVQGSQWIQYQHEPLLGVETAYQVGRSTEGAPLTVRNRVYPLGIGMPSRSSVVYPLPRSARRFQFGVAIDQSAGEGGDATCQVLVLDEKDQWTSVWTTRIRGGEAPQFAELEVDGARAIALTVDYGDRADILDRVDWLMPRFER